MEPWSEGTLCFLPRPPPPHEGLKWYHSGDLFPLLLDSWSCSYWATREAGGPSTHTGGTEQPCPLAAGTCGPSCCPSVLGVGILGPRKPTSEGSSQCLPQSVIQPCVWGFSGSQ